MPTMHADYPIHISLSKITASTMLQPLASQQKRNFGDPIGLQKNITMNLPLNRLRGAKRATFHHVIETLLRPISQTSISQTRQVIFVDRTLSGLPSAASKFHSKPSFQSLLLLKYHKLTWISRLAHPPCTPEAAVDALPRTTYSPFPTTPLANSEHSSQPAYLHPTEPTHTQHKSWAVRVESKMNQAPLRPRAHTSPSQFKAKHPSNLSTCTTLDNESSSTTSSSSTHLYMRSAPVSPQFAPPLMDMMKSAWDYDDDEDDQGKSQRFVEWVEKLHIRSRSTNTRSLRKALKGVFGKKKGATL
jgi:hypothetical protein